eukprot:scaffold130677_cov20-Prasinocladus_malaysianus.AAC.1
MYSPIRMIFKNSQHFVSTVFLSDRSDGLIASQVYKQWAHSAIIWCLCWGYQYESFPVMYGLTTASCTWHHVDKGKGEWGIPLLVGIIDRLQNPMLLLLLWQNHAPSYENDEFSGGLRVH